MGNKARLPAESLIKRSFTVSDFATNDDNNGHIEGHAAVFEQKANIGGYFYEVIERGAFDNCDFTDVPFLINHDESRIPIARSRRNNGSSTMTIKVDDIGLYISADLDLENNPEARSLHSAVKRGDIDGMSFCFAIRDEEWTDQNTEMPIRTIKSIAKVFEVSAVNFAAYSNTDINVRSLDNDKLALENVRKTHRAGQLGKLELEKQKIKIIMEVLK